MKIFEFFEEENGRLSSMRLFCFMLVFTGCFLLSYSLIKSPGLIIDTSVITAALMVVGGGLTGKVVQKKDEST